MLKAAVAVAAMTLAVAVTGVASDTYGQCTYYNTATKATFDLSRLKLGSGAAYTVDDLRDHSQFNFTYTYNFCGPARPPVPGTACGDPTANANVAAYQTRNSDLHCTPLNNNYQNVTWHLINPEDPTKGVAMTYHGGRTCGSKPGVNRQLSLRVHCIENLDTDSNPYEQPRVDEPTTCHYALELYSPEGCPRECPVNNGFTCSGTGVCGFDSDAGAPRCFCDAYHDGADCSSPAPSKPSRCDGVCVAMVVLVILLAVLLTVSCVIFWRVQKLETMNIRFGAATDNLPPGNPHSASDRVN